MSCYTSRYRRQGCDTCSIVNNTAHHGLLESTTLYVSLTSIVTISCIHSIHNCMSYCANTLEQYRSQLRACQSRLLSAFEKVSDLCEVQLCWAAHQTQCSTAVTAHESICYCVANAGIAFQLQSPHRLCETQLPHATHLPCCGQSSTSAAAFDGESSQYKP